MLKSAVSQNGGRNWKKIAATAFAGMKTDVQCLHRWQKVRATRSGQSHA